MKNIKRDFRSNAFFQPPGSTFSEYGHVPYQIKRIDAYSIIVANILPADTPYPHPNRPWGGVKRSKLNFFRIW